MTQSRMHDQMKYVQNAISTMTNLMQELNEIVIIDRVYNFDVSTAYIASPLY